MDLNEVKQEELYEQFQEWLNQCPIKITNYEDNITEFAVDFEIPTDIKELERCITEGTDYSECVDALVQSMEQSQ